MKLIGIKRSIRRKNGPKRPRSRHTFNYHEYTWDIDVARRLLSKRRKKRLHYIDVDIVYGCIRWDLPDAPDPEGRSVNVDYAMAISDVRKPLIFGLVKDLGGEWYTTLIDGHHRLFRAKQEGLQYLPAYYLTKLENFKAMGGRRPNSKANLLR